MAFRPGPAFRLLVFAACWTLAVCARAQDDATAAAPATCADRLPAAEVRVQARHGLAQVHYQHSARELWQRLGARPDSIALGLTETSTALSLELALHAVDVDGQTCARPRIDLIVSQPRVDIMLAREIEHEPCVAELVLAHELEHVAIEREALEFAVRELQNRMQRYYAERIYLGSAAGILQRLMREHELHWTPQLRRLLKSVLARHDQHDERDATDRQACEGALLALSRQLD